MSLLKDLSFSAIVAGFVTVLVGFSSSGVLVFQAAQALGASPAQTSSWLWALCMGMAVTSIGLSLRYRIPIATAWSTAAAAMLITMANHLNLAQATGAFMMSGLLIALSGFTGLFERVMARVPMSLASAMLVGILLRFGLEAFAAIQTQALMVVSMLVSYLVLRRFKPRYAVLAALSVGLGLAYLQHGLDFSHLQWTISRPVWVSPVFSVHSFISVAIPLFIVTMASQNMAGVAALRSFGYQPPISPIIGWTGMTTLVFAPFGAFAINLAAITAAICMSQEAHEHKSKRYMAAVFAGIFYFIMGIFAATMTAIFAAFPQELVIALAGIALLGTIGNGLASALQHEHEREAALITFLVTASGVTIMGISSAFWGVIAGGAALFILSAT
jgi:benzoate membrane transport protein